MINHIAFRKPTDPLNISRQRKYEDKKRSLETLSPEYPHHLSLQEYRSNLIEELAKKFKSMMLSLIP